APTDTPSYRRGAVEGHIAVEASASDVVEETVVIGAASDASKEAAAVIAQALSGMSGMLADEAEELGRIDRIAGDGDHGIGMQRGSRAASEAAAAARDGGAGAQTLLKLAGDAWADKGGGTSGAIWGEMLVALGAVLGDEAAVDAAAVGA